MARVGGWELEPQRKAFELTEEAAALLGVAPTPGQATCLQGALTPGSHQALMQAVNESLDRVAPLDCEVELKRPIGKARWLRLMGQVRGAPAQLFGAIQDVTEQHLKREEALAASRSKSTFLAHMSHEIRTPLNVVIGMTELVLETRLDEEQREFLEMARSSGRHLLGIVNDILDISRIEASKLELEAVPLSLVEVVAQAVRNQASKAEAQGLELVISCAPGLELRRVGDPLRLGQIVTNLVGNAVKFTERGEVEARIEPGRTAGAVRILVRDTGIGIPPDRLDAVFEAFTQSDGTMARRFGGTGLGLTITRELTRLMGGTLNVESEVGRGSSFSIEVTLPVDPQGAASATSAPLAVLVVDRNATSRAAIAELLTGLGHTVAAAPTLAEGLTRVRAPGAAFDVAVIDRTDVADDPGVLAAVAASVHRLVRTSARALPQVTSGARTLLKPLTPRVLSDALRSETGSGLRGAPQSAEEAPPLRVLLAEDNPINARLAIRLLNKLNHAVQHVENGRLAVEAAATGSFDVVLMDMQMPELDGLAATRVIRAAELEARRPRLPIFALTANAMKGDEEVCLSAGMDGYLTKPIERARLSALLLKVPPGARDAEQLG
jgi:signal transduction histidine kinase/CheY-like chemotaxis protein